MSQMFIVSDCISLCCSCTNLSRQVNIIAHLSVFMCHSCVDWQQLRRLNTVTNNKGSKHTLSLSHSYTLKSPLLSPLRRDFSFSSPTLVKGPCDDMCHPLQNISLSCFSLFSDNLQLYQRALRSQSTLPAAH